MKALLSLLLLLGATDAAAGARPAASVLIPGGSYAPLYRIDTLTVTVDSFYLDVYPVTNRQFLEFISQYPAWRRSQVKAIFADSHYLQDWTSDTTFSAAIAESPVTRVSWFAAKKYCDCQGRRLPTIDEWELVALADEKSPRGAANGQFYQRILEWYDQPTPPQWPAVGKTFRNAYGVWDMHGLVWEWVADFNNAIVTDDSRDGASLDRNRFCAGGATNAVELKNYAAFMRYAFRSSLRSNYAVSNLGFRCAKSLR